jgi:indolepyruvate ferredoxin oxidoreductase beta subunit
MNDTGSLPAQRPLSLLICAMGGEGGGVLTGWIVEAARSQGLAVQATSVPGVAQRTGGTTYYVEMAPRGGSGRAPVFALTPVPGQVDVVLASELAEGARAARLGFATPDRTTAISSTHRVFLIQEKMAMSDGRIDPAALRRSIEARSRHAVFLDMEALAQASGVPISPVLLGALAGSGIMPIERRYFEAAIRESGIAVAKNLSAFEAAFARVADPSVSKSLQPAATPKLAPDAFIIESIADNPPELAPYPPAARKIIVRGIERLTDYQDADYGALYLRRLEPFCAFDAELVTDVARHLALRMSYEDVIRVAQHKARAERFKRIEGEVGGANEPFEVQDFFKPGVREIADILPPRLARFVLRRAEKSKRLAGAHIGMKVKTTTVSGYLRVWLLARMRPWRRRTFRYETEQSSIEAWLRLVERAARKGDTALAREIAELARLIKGYGDTHLRGQKNYGRIAGEIVVPALDRAPVSTEAAAAVRAAREAALAD